MRDFLTGIAIILVVVLTTILVAPYFVDWNGQRDFLEARLSHALGQKVTVGGAIDLKLLPTPYLVLDQVVVGADDAPIRVGVRHLNLELAIAPLLHGEFDIVEARLREPTIRVTLEVGHGLPMLPAAPAFSADVRFDRIRVEEGTLAVADSESGRTFVIDHLDLDADAASFAGPFKIVGAGGPPDRRTSFRLSTGELKEGRVRTRLNIDENSEHAGADFDGLLNLQKIGRAVVQTAEGKLVLTGHVPRLEKDRILWRFSGPLQASPRQAQIEGGELRLGSEETGLTLQADARASFGEAAKLGIDLKAKQLDIDRLSGVPASGPRAPPQLPEMADARVILAAATPTIPTELALSVETATYAGETLSGIELRTVVGDAASHPVKLAIAGPGGSRVVADGDVTAGREPSFSGRLDLVVEDLPRALDWARAVAPSFPWTGSDARFERVKLAGPVRLNAREMSSANVAAVLDRTQLNGKVRLMFGSEQQQKLVADLRSESLDLDRLPTLDRLLGGSDAFDLDLRLDAKAVRVSRVGDGTLDAGRIRIDLEKVGERIALRNLGIDDLGGATVKASGDLGPGSGRLRVTLVAGRLDAAAGLFRQLAPGALADATIARAPALAPASLDVEASLRRKGGTFVPTSLAILGSLAATKVDMAVKPEPAGSGSTALSVSLQSPNGGALLHQFGLETVPIETVGFSRVNVTAHGKPGELFDTKLETSFGTTKGSLTGRFDLLTVAPHGSGDVELHSSDLAPLLQTLAFAFPDMTRRLPADAKGRLKIEKGEVSVSTFAGRVAGAETKGMLRWQGASEDRASLTGALEVERLSLSSLVGLALGHEQPTPANAVWSRQPFAVGLIDPPRAALSIRTKVLNLLPGLEASNARLDLGIASNTVSIEHLAADLGGGHVAARVKLRRDGRDATAEGGITLDQVHVDMPSTLDASLDAKLDFAGGGTSAFGLMSSLAGSGKAKAMEVRVAGADPKALQRIFDDVETDVLAVDQDAVIRAYNETPRGALSAGTLGFGLRLAAGVVHFDPKSTHEAAGPATAFKADAALDLRLERFSAHVEETVTALPKNWSGSPPTISITLDGPVRRPSRSIDVSGFLNAVAARALARESARIEAYELDVRERAFFNARLQSERRREEERQKSEDDAKAEADRKARLEAARQERLRKEHAAKAAREADEKAARESKEQGARDGKEPTQRNDAKEGGDRPKADEPANGAPKDPSTLGRY